jgi:hypothetical protein
MNPTNKRLEMTVVMLFSIIFTFCLMKIGLQLLITDFISKTLKQVTNDRFQFSCHLDDRRDLSVRRDLAPLIFNSPRKLVEMTALMQLSVIFTLCPIKIGLQLRVTLLIKMFLVRHAVPTFRDHFSISLSFTHYVQINLSEPY